MFPDEVSILYSFNTFLDGKPISRDLKKFEEGIFFSIIAESFCMSSFCLSDCARW